VSLAALPVDEPQHLNVDVQTATRTILGALPERRVRRDLPLKSLKPPRPPRGDQPQ
jgi:hypothetical protein